MNAKNKTKNPGFGMKKTKLVCTLGPACHTSSMIEKIEAQGANALRINTAFGDFGQYREYIENARRVTDAPIIFDLKGADTRIVTGKERALAKGDLFEVGFRAGDADHFNRDVRKYMEVGETVVMNAGLIQCSVEEKEADRVVLKAKTAGFLKNGSSVHVFGKEFDLPSMSSHDFQVVDFAKKLGEEFFALSFVRNRKDVEALRKKSKNGIIISKIESKGGVENIAEIVEASDAIMVARGDLGIELPPEFVPRIQKDIIKRCNMRGKACIVATQMLESMTSSPIPTRAEVSDIANAILDGADAVMLSGETATGKYPLEAVKTITRTAIQTEKYVQSAISRGGQKTHISKTICDSVIDIVGRTHVTKVVTPTRSGYTARMVSRYKLPAFIYAVTASKAAKAHLALYYGVEVVESKKQNVNAFECMKLLQKNGIVRPNDIVLMTLGEFSKNPTTNTIHLIDVKNTVFGSK